MPKKKKKIELQSIDAQPLSLADRFADHPELADFIRAPESGPGEAPAKPDGKPNLTATLRLTLERKGRAGKTVTLLTGLGGNGSDLKSFLKELKSSLGCGATVEDGQICFQGDQRARLTSILRARGAKKIHVG